MLIYSKHTTRSGHAIKREFLFRGQNPVAFILPKQGGWKNWPLRPEFFNLTS